MISPSIAFLVMSDPQLELTEVRLTSCLGQVQRRLTTDAVTVLLRRRILGRELHDDLACVEPEPTSWAASAGGEPASANAFSTSFGVIEVPVTVIWYCVPPLNSTPMLKPRKTKLMTLIRMITADA